jgi:hypothetical protein
MEITSDWVVSHTPAPHKARVEVSGGRLLTTSIHAAIAYSMCKKRTPSNPLAYLAALQAILDHWVPVISVSRKGSAPLLAETIAKTIHIVQVECGMQPICALTDEEMAATANVIDIACAEHERHLLKTAPMSNVIGSVVVRMGAIELLDKRVSGDGEGIKRLAENRAFLEQNTLS